MAIFDRNILEERKRRAAEAFGNRAPTVSNWCGRANSQAWGTRPNVSLYGAS